MKIRAAVVVVMAGCLFGAVLVGGGQAAGLKSCGSVKGAKWVFPNTGGKLSGNTYGVTAVGVDCSTAKTWAVKLSGTRLAGKKFGHSYPLAGGPKGYTCHANPDANGKVLAGSCTAAPKRAFSWGGAPKRG